MSAQKRTNSMSSPSGGGGDDDTTTDGRSPKRQRRSFSPASPPADTKPVATGGQPPQTPPSSVHMSPEFLAQQLPGLGGGSNGGGGAGSVTMPTPPSTAGLYSQMMARGLSSEGGSQTPGGYESESQITQKTEGDVPMKEAESGQESFGEEVGGTVVGEQDGGGNDAMNEESADAENRRSDHERQDAVSALPGANVLYKLHTAAIPSSAPHPSQDLIQLYSLDRLQASVARRDPVTGAKINKLRKSYEGKVKDLGLEGRNKATKSEAILEGLVDPGWDMQGEDGKSWWESSDLSDPPLLGQDDGAGAMARIEGLLERALDLRPGHLPLNEHNAWKNLLGLDDVAPVAATAKAGATTTAAAAPAMNAPRTAASNLLARTAPATAPRSSAPASPRTNGALRPERAGKKRRYDESSYAGYQEGYEDDGYSTGGVDDTTGRRGSGGSKRQKRKDFSPTSTSPPFATSAGGSNSMVGVRSS